MKSRFREVCVWSALLMIPVLPRPEAQTARGLQNSQIQHDVAQEITLSGAVTGVLTKAATGMINGSHLLIASPSGSIDVSLGAYGLVGKGAVSVKLGEQIEVTGRMRMINNDRTLIARTVTAGDHTFVIRNTGGIALSPEARERAGRGMASSGGAQ
jgi:hypothetical protein